MKSKTITIQTLNRCISFTKDNEINTINSCISPFDEHTYDKLIIKNEKVDKKSNLNNKFNHAIKIESSNVPVFPNFIFPQIQNQHEQISKSKNLTNRWTKQEDELLLNIVKKVGPQKWKKIAFIIKTKTEKQCRDHYSNCLDPKINNSQWTEEEEQMLLNKYKEYGPHWSKIKKFLPGRTTLMVKNYLKVMLNRNGNRISVDFCNQKHKLEFDTSSNKKYSDSENVYNFKTEPKDLGINNSDLSIYDINNLLNRPVILNNIL